MIDWKGLDGGRVERAVKSLLRELYPDVQGIDGSGGDDGRDIRWDSPNGLVIFEVKSYRDRLKDSPRRKIKNSLEKAASHNPIRWVLILPLDPSPAEERWFDGLRKRYPKITLEWRGRDWLDAEFAKREHLVRYVEGPLYVLAERARELGLEQAVLADGVPDLFRRANQLSVRAQELSTAWRVDFGTTRKGIVLRYSERCPGSAALDPVTITPTFSFPEDDSEAQRIAEELKQRLDYGGAFKVPGQYVEHIDIHASEETQRLFALSGDVPITELEFVPVEDTSGLPIPCTLEITTLEDVSCASVTVSLTKRTIGWRGATLSGTDASGCLRVTTTLERSDESQLSLGLNFADVRGRWPAFVRLVADFVLSVEPGRLVSVKLEGSETDPVEIGSSELGLEDLKPLARAIVALDDAQRYFHDPFPIPDDLTMKDLRLLVMVQELLSTGRSQWLYDGLKGNIRADRLNEFLADAESLSRQGAMLVDYASVSLEFAGHRFDLGPIHLYGSKMRLTNLDEIRSAVGTGVDPEARWACINGEHIVAFRIPPSA